MRAMSSRYSGMTSSEWSGVTLGALACTPVASSVLRPTPPAARASW